MYLYGMPAASSHLRALPGNGFQRMPTTTTALAATAASTSAMTARPSSEMRARMAGWTRGSSRMALVTMAFRQGATSRQRIRSMRLADARSSAFDDASSDGPGA